MHKKFLFTLFSIILIVSFLFYATPTKAKNNGNQENPGCIQKQNGSAAPPWFANPGTFPGGPYWLNNPQEGIGPWFWQAYNGFDVTEIAPAWYLDPLTAECAPSWFISGSGGPWWSSYILEETDG